VLVASCIDVAKVFQSQGPEMVLACLPASFVDGKVFSNDIDMIVDW
jgi:hypothetical protein